MVTIIERTPTSGNAKFEYPYCIIIESYLNPCFTMIKAFFITKNCVAKINPISCAENARKGLMRYYIKYMERELQTLFEI